MGGGGGVIIISFVPGLASSQSSMYVEVRFRTQVQISVVLGGKKDALTYNVVQCNTPDLEVY